MAKTKKKDTQVPAHKVDDLAGELTRFGRYGDTTIAHISPEEMAHLKAHGGSGSTNPVTGLPEFFADDGDDGQSDDAGEGSGESGTDGGSGDSEESNDPDANDDPGPGSGLDDGTGNTNGSGGSHGFGLLDPFAFDPTAPFSVHAPAPTTTNPMSVQNAFTEFNAPENPVMSLINALIGRSQTLGLDPANPTNVETQHEINFSPLSMLASALFGPAASVAALGAKAFGIQDPTSFSFNTNTNSFSKGPGTPGQTNSFDSALNGAFDSISNGLQNPDTIGELDNYDGPDAGDGNFEDFLSNNPRAQAFNQVQGTPFQTQLDTLFQELIGNTTNPFLREGQTSDQLANANQEFQSTLLGGLLDNFGGLGQNPNQSQFDQVFKNPSLTDNIFAKETDTRRSGFNDKIGEAFPGDAFTSLDDSIIDSIVNERGSGARQQVSTFAARGNLNQTGGQSANDFLSGQTDQARSRVREVGQGVLGQNQSRVNDVRDQATQKANSFNLGDDLFDIQPFTEQRQRIIDEQTPQLGSQINTALGGEALFDVPGALSAGGRRQGQVSGASGQNASLLDTLSQREQGTLGVGQDKRGLTGRGSGTF